MPTSSTCNRLNQRFAELRAVGRRAFVVYLCAGDPSLDATVELVCALAEVGVDVIELGVPYSDPMADGPANQAACERALAAGATLAGVIDVVARLRARGCEVPIIFFTYLNPLIAQGVERFAAAAAKAGVDGILPLDLPIEEDAGIPAALQAAGLATLRLVAPNTVPVRRARLVAASQGFLYYVCRYGVTGERADLPADLAQQVADLRRHGPVPICIGFGISSPEQAAAAARCGDGVVVGSHLVRLIERYGSDPDLVQRVAARARELVDAVHAV